MAPMIPSAELAVIVGQNPLPRTEVTKKLWKWIKIFKLQDPNDKRTIICDAALKAIMHAPRVDMFAMHKMIGKHLTKAAAE